MGEKIFISRIHPKWMVYVIAWIWAADVAFVYARRGLFGMGLSEGEQPGWCWQGMRSCGKSLLARACVEIKGAKALRGPIGVAEPMLHVVAHCRPVAPLSSVCPAFVRRYECLERK